MACRLLKVCKNDCSCCNLKQTKPGAFSRYGELLDRSGKYVDKAKWVDISFGSGSGRGNTYICQRCKWDGIKCKVYVPNELITYEFDIAGPPCPNGHKPNWASRSGFF
jgi:hypothetical protein